MVAITESCMSVDDFENPKLFKDAEAVAVLLTRRSEERRVGKEC